MKEDMTEIIRKAELILVVAKRAALHRRLRKLLYGTMYERGECECRAEINGILSWYLKHEPIPYEWSMSAVVGGLYDGHEEDEVER